MVGVIVKKVFKEVVGMEILAYVSAVRDVKIIVVNYEIMMMDDVELNIVWCLDESCV